MKLVFSSDHAGFDLRNALAVRCQEAGHEIQQVGAPSTDSYDYPNASDALVRLIRKGSDDLGVLICGTGIGVSIRANRYKHIRAALCTNVEMAKLGRQHNQANVLCMGARITTENEAWDILQAFLATQPSNEPRHVHRVELLDSPLES